MINIKIQNQLKIIIMEQILKISERLRNRMGSQIVKINGDIYEVQPLFSPAQTAPEWGNYFDFNNRKRLTYHPKPEKQGITDTGKWKTEGRQELRPGKLIEWIFEQCAGHFGGVSYGAIMKLESPENDGVKALKKALINAYIEAVTAALCDFDYTGILCAPMDEIADIYALPTGAGSGTLARSCMRSEESDDHKAPFREFYAELSRLGASASIIYTKNEQGELTGRAVKWDNVILRDGREISFVDRIYGNETTVAMFKEYAQSQGWAHKETQSYNDTELILPDGSRYIYSYQIKLTGEYDCDRAPYMDTFGYINESGNLDIAADDFLWAFRNTNGTADKMGHKCAYCGDYVSGDYRHDGEYFCEDCYYDRFITCEECGEIIDTQNDVCFVLSTRRNGTQTFCNNCCEQR